MEPPAGQRAWRCTFRDRKEAKTYRALALERHPQARIVVREGRCAAFFGAEF